MNINFSEMTQAQLRRCGAHTVGTAMEIHISEKDVTPLEAAGRRFWFRIGEMYFDLKVKLDGTTSLYVGSDDESIQIASFRPDGNIIRGR